MIVVTVIRQLKVTQLLHLTLNIHVKIYFILFFFVVDHNGGLFVLAFNFRGWSFGGARSKIESPTFFFAINLLVNQLSLLSIFKVLESYIFSVFFGC